MVLVQKKLQSKFSYDCIYKGFYRGFFKSFNVENRHYELYSSMTVVMHLFIVIEIQLFKVKLKIIFNSFNKARERWGFNSDCTLYKAS